MTQLGIQISRSQATVVNRAESPFVPLVGESAVRLAHVGLAPVRIDGLPHVHDVAGTRLVRARRDRVGRLGEYRAFVVEEPGQSVASLAFVPRPNLDLGVFGTEISQTPGSLVASFGIYAGTGTWFAGQHAHHAWQEVREAAPDLVADEGQRSARARQRGFTFQVRVERDELHRLEDLHRRLWAAYVRSLHDALDLDVDGTEKNARSLEAWKSHKRTVGLVARVLAESGAVEPLKLHAEVMTA